jgi:hypothetical protein
MHLRKKTYVVMLAMSCLVGTGDSQDVYFFKGRDFGSEALFNPVNFLLNSSFDIIQLDEHTRNIFDLPYHSGFTNVWKNISSPFGPITRYGWGNFLADQVFPVHVNRKGAAWWPNYQLHLIGGGMSYTALREWYRAHDFPGVVGFSIATKIVETFLNEAVENGRYAGDNVDPIADLLIFDPAGVILFSFDSINRFFSEDLNLADWSLQPSFTLSPAALHNNGQNFSIKWRIPFSERWHLFYYFGMNGLLGLSHKANDGLAISVGAGLRAKRLVLLDQATNHQTLDLVWNAAIFVDQDNSLLASLFFSGLTEYAIDLNLYPGFLRIGSFSPGLWFVYGRERNIIAGITTTWAPGLGTKLR